MKYLLILYALIFADSKVLLSMTGERTRPLIAITIPKSGTHLLYKCLEALTKKIPSFGHLIAEGIADLSCNPHVAAPLIEPSLTVFDKVTTNLYTNEYVIGHLIYNPIYKELLHKKNFKILFLVRDPRDQIVSRAFYIKQHSDYYPGLQHLSIKELIRALIGSEIESQVFDNLTSSHLCFLNKPTQQSISNILYYYKSYLPWSSVPNCYTIKFENLVGPKGNGSLEKQKIEIKNIINHLNLVIYSKQINNVIENSFGNTHTFREGKIGSWKKYFTQEDKALFKTIAGNLLIELGYEQDTNW